MYLSSRSLLSCWCPVSPAPEPATPTPSGEVWSWARLNCARAEKWTHTHTLQQRNEHTHTQAWADWHTRVTQWIIYSSRNLTVTPVTSPPWLCCTDKANRDKHTTWQTPAITRASEKDGCWYKWELTADLKHTPGSLLLQHLCRFGALIDYLSAFGVFNLALIRRHLGPQRLLGFHVAVAPAGTALRSKPHGSLQSCSGNEALDEIPDPTYLIKYFLQKSL